jgi:hypothetical protein
MAEIKSSDQSSGQSEYCSRGSYSDVPWMSPQAR